MATAKIIDKQLQAFLQRGTSRSVASLPPDFFKLNTNNFPVTAAAPPEDGED